MSKSNGNEIVAYISIDPLDEKRLALNFDPDTLPTNTDISGRGTIDAIVNPETFNPITNGAPAVGKRYLILENINVNRHYNDPGYSGPVAWKNSTGPVEDPVLYANDIIEWDGGKWNVVFNSLTTTAVTYITNSYTGVQYKWENNSWSKSIEGIYSKELWRIIL